MDNLSTFKRFLSENYGNVDLNSIDASIRPGYSFTDAVEDVVRDSAVIRWEGLGPGGVERGRFQTDKHQIVDTFDEDLIIDVTDSLTKEGKLILAKQPWTSFWTKFLGVQNDPQTTIAVEDSWEYMFDDSFDAVQAGGKYLQGDKIITINNDKGEPIKELTARVISLTKHNGRLLAHVNMA